MDDKEIIAISLSARNRVQLSDEFQKAAEKKFGKKDLASLDLGLKLPDRFLMPDGPQPTMAELTVISQKLDMQIQVGQIDVFATIAVKQAEAVKAASKK